jgi:hypothetical protein
MANPTAEARKKMSLAKRGNRNRVTSGLRMFQQGRWPAGTTSFPRMLKELGDGLRKAVTEVCGSTNVLSEAYISTILVHQGRALLLLRLYRRNQKSLRPAELSDLLEKIGKAYDSRDRVLEKLKLDIKKPETDPWQDLLKRPALPSVNEPELIDKPEQEGTGEA